MIINLPTKRILSDGRITNISKNFTHKMAAKTSWQIWNEITSLSPYVFRPTNGNLSIYGKLLSVFAVSMCLLFTTTSCAKMDKPIKMLSGLWIGVGPRNYVVGGAPIPPGERGISGTSPGPP